MKELNNQLNNDMRRIFTLTMACLLAGAAWADEVVVPEYCLENDKAHAYLNRGTYPDDDYSFSWIMDYCYSYPWNWKVEGKGVRLDHPKPVTIYLEDALESASTLYVSESADFADAWTFDIPEGQDSIDVYNLIPGRTYNYKVVYAGAEGEVKTADNGQFKTTGHLRMLKIDGIFNVRDLGGWEGLKGYPMKYGRIIRGSRLNVNNASTKIITEAGIKEMRKLGVSAELDMRNSSNAAGAKTSFLGSDIPIYNVENAYNSRIATFANGPQSIQGVNKLIEWLKAGRNVYTHCSVGADRTGTVVFLVGAVCGMSEDALAKDFELTSFSGDWIENERDKPNPERLIRQRNYKGRLDPNDNNESYKYAKMIDQVKAFPGETFQQKVYYHLTTGVNGTKVSKADLDWLINYMIGPLEVTSAKSVTVESGKTSQIEAKIVNVSALNPNPTVSYTSADEKVATVSETGLITAVKGGKTTITVEVDGFKQSISVNVPLKETVLPDTVICLGSGYRFKGVNQVVNGSFEYADQFYGWTSATKSALSEEHFKVVTEAGNSYLQSKADGDELSSKSMRQQWYIMKNKVYVFGYSVKNTSGKKVENDSRLAVSLVKYTQPKIEGTGDNFEWDDAATSVSQRADSRDSGTLSAAGDTLTFAYPSYDGNWTDVQYVFANEDGYMYCQLWFTHLSKDGDNICLDNFYMAELECMDTAVPLVHSPRVEDGRMYNLLGQPVSNPKQGEIVILNGRKYLVK